jgi:hypothetical protein
MVISELIDIDKSMMPTDKQWATMEQIEIGGCVWRNHLCQTEFEIIEEVFIRWSLRMWRMLCHWSFQDSLTLMILFALLEKNLGKKMMWARTCCLKSIHIN